MTNYIIHSTCKTTIRRMVCRWSIAPPKGNSSIAWTDARLPVAHSLPIARTLLKRLCSNVAQLLIGSWKSSEGMGGGAVYDGDDDGWQTLLPAECWGSRFVSGVGWRWRINDIHVAPDSHTPGTRHPILPPTLPTHPPTHSLVPSTSRPPLPSGPILNQR